MPTSTASVAYRPIRLGLLVRQNDIADLVKAAEMCALLWGGVRNPLISVSDEPSQAKALLDLFAVDVLISVSDSTEAKTFANEFPFLRSPSMGDGLFYEDWVSKKLRLQYLDIINLVDSIWNDEFKHSSPETKSNCAFVDWSDDDALATLLAIQFGRYPRNIDLADDFDEAFKLGLKAETVSVALNGDFASELSSKVTPLELTTQLLGASGRGRVDSGIYFGDPNDFKDLISFWNIRAAGARLQFLPKGHDGRLKGFIETYLNSLDEHPPTAFDDSIALYARDDLLSNVPDFVAKAVTKRQRFSISMCPELWNGLNIRPAAYHFGWSSVLANVDEASGRTAVSIGLPPKNFLSSSVDRRGAARASDQQLAASIDILTEFSYPKRTLKPPYLRRLNEFYSREITIDPWGLRVERDGLAAILKIRDNAVTLYPLDHQALIERLFAEAGMHASTSQPGLIAAQIISGMRGFDPLRGCAVFKITGVRRLIKEIAADQLLPWIKALPLIGGDNFRRFKRLYIEPREDEYLTAPQVLSFLIKKRILRPVLGFIARFTLRRTIFKCPTCGLTSSLRPRQFEGSWRCPYCGTEHYRAEYVAFQFRKKSGWFIKKSGLFAKDNNQEGAIPVILALMRFSHYFHLGGFLYSTALNLRGDVTCETDLCIVQYRNIDAVEMGIGECKGDGGWITDDDIEKLIAARAKLLLIGVKPYLIFAKTASGFYEHELARFRALRERSVPFILMTNRDLEALAYPADDDALPLRTPFSLSDMATNALISYLS
jgi:hypothetical protein